MKASRRRKIWTVLAAVVLILGIAGLVGMAGCGGDNREAAHDALNEATETTVGGPVYGASPSEDSSGDGVAYSPETSSGIDEALGGTLGALQSGSGQKVITTAQLSIEVETGKFQTAFNQALLLADRFGGYVVSSDTQASGEEDSLKSGTVTVRIPVASFSSALGEAGKLGEVKYQSIGTEDVTQEYVDLEARITNSEANVRQLLQLFAKAETVDEILKVQSVLNSAQEELEQLKGRQRYLDENTSYSTLTMGLYEAGAEVVPVSGWGFVGALKDALHNIVDAFSQVARGLGWLVPILVVIAVIGVIVYFIVKRAIRRNRESAEERARMYQQRAWVPAAPAGGTQGGAGFPAETGKTEQTD
jgi:hypothetical protein